ncbi:MAG: Hsp20/alpha crystallin family protein [Puniceicoccaceae bacterium]
MTTEISKKEKNEVRTPDMSRRPYYRVLGGNGKESYTVEVFMPGVAKGDYNVSLHDQELLIEGRKVLPIPSDAKWVHREITIEPYKLRLQLNVDVDAEGITARSEDGILRVLLPVAAEARPRKITIQ